MIESPCLNCSERHLGCHSECEKYGAYKAECERVSEARRAANKIDASINAIVIGGIRRSENGKRPYGKCIYGRGNV